VKGRALPIFASVAGACLVGLLLYGVSHQAASRTLDELVAKQQYPPAPDASRLLPVLGGGGLRSLTSLKGQVVVLNFWASWCEPCQQEAPLLQHAEQQLTRHDATVLGVAYRDATPDSERFVRSFHLTYPSLRDNTGQFAQSYGTNELPESFIINRAGRIVAISRGEVGKSFIAHAEALAQST